LLPRSTREAPNLSKSSTARPVTFAICAIAVDDSSAVSSVAIPNQATTLVKSAIASLGTFNCHHNSAILESSSKVTGSSVLICSSSLLIAENSASVHSRVFFTPAKAVSKLLAVLEASHIALAIQNIAVVAIVIGFIRFDTILFHIQLNLLCSLETVSSHVLRKFCNFLLASVRLLCALFVSMISSLFNLTSSPTSFSFAFIACSFIVAFATSASNFIFLAWSSSFPVSLANSFIFLHATLKDP
jgi:hypothetical protein